VAILFIKGTQLIKFPLGSIVMLNVGIYLSVKFARLILANL